MKFFLYFLWKALVGFLAGMAILLAVLVTCCIALIPLIIPYLGAVLMLPVSVFLRGLGPEFIRQFGPEYDLFSDSEPG